MVKKNWASFYTIGVFCELEFSESIIVLNFGFTLIKKKNWVYYWLFPCVIFPHLGEHKEFFDICEVFLWLCTND